MTPLSASECLWWQDAHYPDVLGRWLDYLQSSAPGAVVLPVLTQCDKLLPKAVSPLEVRHADCLPNCMQAVSPFEVRHLERVVEEQVSC